MEGVVWHYTPGIRLREIVRSGFIKRADAGVVGGERPAVWFTRSESWEETANKMIPLQGGGYCFGTRESTEQIWKGLFRIGVSSETAPISWIGFGKQSGISVASKNALTKTAKRAGSNVYDWCVTFDEVRRDKWLFVQKWNGKAWETFDPQLALTISGGEQ
jgi:hypothetical protein